MLVVHKFEACGRCRGATMWRLKNCNLFCERCQRRKDVPRRRPSPVHLAALVGLLVIVAAWVAFAFGESGHKRQIDQALEPEASGRAHHMPREPARVTSQHVRPVVQVGGVQV